MCWDTKLDTFLILSKISIKFVYSLGKFGGIFVKKGLKPTDIEVYCSRPGLRIWVADINGAVERTLLFKVTINYFLWNYPRVLKKHILF